MDSHKNQDCKKKSSKFSNLRKLRLSLKYRPDILKLVIKLRHCIKKKSHVISFLKLKLKNAEKNNVDVKDSYTQTSDLINSKEIVNPPSENNSLVTNTSTTSTKQEMLETDVGWNINKETENKVSIADQVKEAAQSALQQSGMVYVESAGMYYDYKTGYYYNSELGLYYHTDTNCYYYYSEEKKNFVFHSYPDRSAEVTNLGLIAHEKKKAKKHKKDKEEGSEATKPKRKKKSKKEVLEDVPADDSKMKNENGDKLDNEIQNEDKKDLNIFEDTEKKSDSNKDTEEEKVDEELEDGECSGTDTEESDDDLHDSTSTASEDGSIARHHPPCMRIIVKETTLPKLKIGTLFLITKDGGSIGREGDHHCVVLRDQNVSRNHLNITYDMNKKWYVAMDLGSKNGTILNGVRMSESQTVSKSLAVVHGSILDIGETKLLCHIHPGTDTCGHCEPGLLMETQEKEKKAAYTRTCSVQRQHQLELARLKNKYAPKPLAIEATPYNDRALARRDTVGSSHHSEKTQSSDLDTFIAPENKGFKLLEKMGWSKGEGLGKDNQGDTEPIPLVSNEGKAGLGTGAVSSGPPVVPLVNNKLGTATMRLASKTKMLRPPAKAFQVVDDEDETE